jgi:hypothetical protein
MKANTVLIKTRHYLQDLQSVKFSDWEIYQGISDALRIFAEEAARMHDGAGIFSSVISLTMSGGSALLPENYIRIKRAYGSTGKELLRVITDTPGEGEFAIRGGSIMSGEPTITLHYFSFPGKVDQPEDVIDLPDSMLIALAKISASCVVGSDTATIQVAQYFNGQPIADAAAKGSE